MSEQTVMAWGLYGASSFFLLLVLLRITHWIKQTDLRLLLRILGGCLLFTPARLTEGSEHWVPAFIAVLLDAVTIGTDAAVERLFPLIATMLAVLLLSLLIKYGWLRRKAAAQP